MGGTSIALLVLISVLVFASGFISAAYDLRDKANPYFFSSLTSHGRLVVALTILILILTITQFIYTNYSSEQAATKRDSILRSEYRQSIERMRNDYVISSDSLKIKYDTSTANIIEALAKYGLKYDTAQERIEKLVRDSSNNKTTIIQGDAPTVRLCNDDGLKLSGWEKDTLRFSIKLCSYSASSILNNLQYYILCSENSIVDDLSKLEYVGNHEWIKQPFGITKEGYIIGERNIRGWHVHAIKYVYILIKGAYTDSYGKNIKQIDQIGVLNVTNGKFEGTLTGNSVDIVHSLLERNGVGK
jgi:hypothetical protein